MRTKTKAPLKDRHGRLMVEQLESRVLPAGAFSTLANDLTPALNSVVNTVFQDVGKVSAPLPIIGETLAQQAGIIQTNLNGLVSVVSGSLGTQPSNATASAISNALSALTVFGNPIFSSVSVPTTPGGTFDPAHNSVTVLAHFHMQIDLGSTNFDLGLPGVPFSLTTQLDLKLDIDYGDVSFVLKNNVFSVNTPTGSQLSVTLSAQVPNLSAQGTLGFFSMSASPVNASTPAISLSFGLALDASGASLSNPHLVGDANVDLKLAANLSSSPTGVTFPHIETDFVMNWNLASNNSVVGSSTALGSAPTVEFDNVEFGLGSFLGSMLAPIANVVDEVTAPLAPVYAIMQTALPGLSDLSEAAGIGPISIDTLLSAAVGLNILPPDYQLLADLGLRLHNLVELIRSANFGPSNDALIPIGSFNLSGSGDLRAGSLANKAKEAFDDWLKNPVDFGSLTALVPVAIDATTSVEDRIKNNIASLKLPSAVQDQVSQIFSQIDETLLDAENGVGLTFPLLDNPSSIFELLLGQDVDFVKFHFQFRGNASETDTIPVWGPIQAGFSGKITAALVLDAGVDTYGLRQFFINFIKNPKKAPDFSVLDQSFYVDPTKPLVDIFGKISAEAGPKLTFGVPDGPDVYAEATFTGSIQTDQDVTVAFDKSGIGADGKVRPIGKSGNLFTVGGKITANLSFSVSGGVELIHNTPPIVKHTFFTIPLTQKTLLDTAASVSTANPLNGSQPIDPHSIDFVFNANGYGDGIFGNFLYVRVENGKVNFTYNGVLIASPTLANLHSITIYGSADEGTLFSISGDFGGNVPLQIDAGATNNLLFFDDGAYNGSSPPVYSVHDNQMEREALLTLAGAPVLLPTTVINFEDIQLVTLNAATGLSDVISAYNLTTQTSLVGGNQGNQFLLGGPGESLTSLSTFLNIVGGLGYDQLILDDENTTNPAAYSIGHDSIDRTLTTTFTSPFVPRGPQLVLKFEQRFDYSSIDDVEIEAGIGGNHFNVNDVPTSSDTNPTALNVVLDTGEGADTVTLTATTGQVAIHGQGGNDVVNVGVPNRGTLDISDRVSIDNSAPALTQHGTTLNINDADDSTARSVDFDTPITGLGTIAGFVGTHTYPSPFSEPHSTTIISYQISDLVAVNVRGGTGVNTFDVFNTPRNLTTGIIQRSLISTHLTLGTFINTVNVSGTTGPLFIVGGGGLNGVYLGGNSTSPGELANLQGKVTLQGGYGGLVIKDGAHHGFRYYTMNAGSFNAPVGGGIDYSDMTATIVEVSLANDGNQMAINGTPTTVSSGFGQSGVSISTGSGSDFIQVNASSANLSIDMGIGVFQTVGIGSNKASLDAIKDVSIFAGGDTQIFLSDAAATTGQTFNINSLGGDSEGVTRTPSGSTTTLNTFVFHFNNPGQVYLTAGKAGDQFSFSGTPANTTTIVNGGAGQDAVSIETGNTTPPELGPIYFYGTTSQGDEANIFNVDTLAGGSGNDSLSGGSGNDGVYGNSYIFQATPSKSSKPNVLDQQTVQIGGDALITFKGIASLSAHLPSVGNNFVSIQGVPRRETLDVYDADHDRIIFGNAVSSPIGLMTEIRGNASIHASGKNVSVLLDDSIDSTGRHVVLSQATDGSSDVVTGMARGNVNLALGSGSTLKLLGGTGNDTFSLANLPLVGGGGNDTFTPPTVSIDGGQGVNALDYSNVAGLSGPTGVYVNLVTGAASGLSGISHIQNVTGSPFDDILVGNGGNVLDGGAGRDLLIAGAKPSTLRGGAGDDLLIGGTTADDGSFGLLDAVLIGWESTLDASLLNGKVTSNGGGNTLLGQADIDLFFMHNGDNNNIDAKKGETIVYV